jgi:hypothetical protein
MLVSVVLGREWKDVTANTRKAKHSGSSILLFIAILDELSQNVDD